MARIIQEVNFFQDDFQQPVVDFDFEKMQWTIAISALFLITMVFNQWAGVNALQENIDSAILQEQLLMSQIEDKNHLYREPSADPKLVAMLKNIALKNINRRTLFAYVDSLNVLNGPQISSYYTALASCDTAGVWLTEISFKNNGQDIYLQGMSASAHAIPLYVAKLKQSPAFVNKSFQSLDMIRQDEFPHYIEFVLRTDIKSDDV